MSANDWQEPLKPSDMQTVPSQAPAVGGDEQIRRIVREELWAIVNEAWEHWGVKDYKLREIARRAVEEIE